MIKLLYCFLLLFCTGTAFGQVNEAAMAELAQVMKWFDSPSLEVTSTYKAFVNTKATEPVETVKSTFRKKDTLQYLQVGHIEMVRGKNFGLNVNHKEKYVVLQTSAPGVKKLDFTTQMDWMALSKICNSVSHEKIGKQGLITLNFKEGEYESATIAYDAKSYKPIKVDTYRRIGGNHMNETVPVARLLITYEAISVNPRHPAGIFDYKSFLIHSNNKWICQDKYNQYKLTIN